MARSNQAMEDLLRYNAAILPQKRSVFSKNHSHATTLDAGDLVPVMWDRVLPGDEKKIRLSALCRMATPIHPVMDEATISFWAFYVPDRLWWANAKAFYGENLDASFNPDGEYVMPSLKPKQYFVDKAHSDPTRRLNDYFGFPVAHGDLSLGYDTVNEWNKATAGLHRSYQLIWDNYFRNSSIQPALQLNDGDTVSSAEWNVICQLRKVNKLPDMFTSLLREPQSGDDVLLPLGEWAPVVTRSSRHDNSELATEASYSFYNESGSEWADDSTFIDQYYSSIRPDGILSLGDTVIDSSDLLINLVPNNLWADLSSASSASINNLRAAITIQQLLETDALAGKRYQNILQAHFGVFTPDATLQRPEYLGGTKTPIGIRQVLQTGATVDGVSPQGNAAAVSVTNLSNEWVVNKAFTEPGILMVVCAIRTCVSYSQGLNPLLTKLNRYDHYWPVFENLGNQPVYRREVYGDFYTNDLSLDAIGDGMEVFGYKEAWQEYRMMSNRVSGLFRPDVNGTLSSWNYSMNLLGTESLNSAFIEQNSSPVERTLAVTSEPQFLLDTYFEYTDIKNMGVHSIPGLIRL